MHSLPWQGTGLTDRGLVRKSNQDSFAIENLLGLWVIADGMGGHAGGNIASELAVSSIVNHIRTAEKSFFKDQHLPHFTTLLTEAVIAGDAIIQERVQTSPDLKGMGTTVVAALFCPNPEPSVVIAHVGDSRGYRIRDHQINALTIDHSFVQGLVAQGHITAEQANHHSKQNILLKALGIKDASTPDVQVHTLDSRDILLLCTDGLTKSISEDMILSIILEKGNSPDETCQQLIDRANEQGGKDNTTVVLVTPQHPGKG